MSRLVRSNDHGFTYIFGKESLFCDDRLCEMSLEQHLAQTLTDVEKYDLVLFYDRLGGIRFASKEMGRIYAQITGLRIPFEEQGTKIPKLKRRGILSSVKSEESAPSPREPPNNTLVWDRDVLPMFEALLKRPRKTDELEKLNVAIIVMGMEHWLDRGVENLNSFFRKYGTRIANDLIILCFNGFTPSEAIRQYEHSMVSKYLTEWIQSLNANSRVFKNIIQIEAPSQAEIKNLLNRKRLIGELTIPASQLNIVAEEVYKFTRSAKLSLGGFWQQLSNYCRNKDLPIAFDKDSFVNAFGIKLSKTSKQLFNELIGLDFIQSDYLDKIENAVMNDNIDKAIQSYRSRFDDFPDSEMKRNLKLHFALRGNPGTGKSTIAELLGRYLYEIGALSSGHTIKCVAKDLISNHVGETAIKTAERVQEAMGGVLFIDEISGIVGDTNDDLNSRAHGFAKDVNGVLLNAMTSYPDLSVIIAGYPHDVDAFIASDNGFSRRFTHIIELPDYNAEQLTGIFRAMAKKEGYGIAPELEETLDSFMDNWLRQKPYDGTWGNAGEVENLINGIKGTIDRDRIIKIKDIPEKIKSGAFCYDLKNCIRKKGESQPSPLDELDDLIGLNEVKTIIKKKKAFVEYSMRRGEDITGSMNFLFLGNPGTGKTTVARLMGKILAGIKALPYSKLIETRGSELVDRIQGENRAKKIFNSALGGVLFIDEAYGLLSESGGASVITELTAFSENNKGKLSIILAGYPDDMENLLKANKGLASRFPKPQQWINFANYSSEELMEIFKRLCKKNNYSYNDEFAQLLQDYTRLLAIKASRKDFGNAREVRDLFDNCRQELAVRAVAINNADSSFIASDIIACTEGLASVKGQNARQKLDQLIGLEGVKRKVKELSDRIELRKKRRIDIQPQLNFVFAGNPGTGKTTVAEIFGKILVDIGVLPSSKLVEVIRADLVGQWAGHTERNTKDTFESALGGVLFIDEAYSLKTNGGIGHDDGKIITDYLVKFSDQYKGKVCIVLAGYTADMETFLRQNEGLTGRFSEQIVFEDYSNEELFLIFKWFCEKGKYRCSTRFDELLKKCIPVIISRSEFRNGRGMRNLFERCEGVFASRVRDCEKIVNEFIPDDLRNVMEEMRFNLPIEKDEIQKPEYKLPTREQLIKIGADLGKEPCNEQASKEALIKISTSAGTGSGFLITSDGYAVTCNHVVHSNYDTENIKARVRIKDSRGNNHDSVYNCAVVFTDEKVDIAILKLETKENNLPYTALLPYEDRTSDWQGSEIHLLSYPSDDMFDEPSLFKGSIASYQEVNGIDTILLGIKGQPGSPGGICIDPHNGYVMGIFRGSYTESEADLTEEINYAYPVKYLWDIFKQELDYEENRN
jgi:SpoVK/Ycf46/Vps4 family AAA+-type ATPase